uniref:Rho-GAP domain-containing protein n=1 Tax=Lotharella globosa TaxID=91324 RepID=A0A6V3J855_9EUKA
MDQKQAVGDSFEKEHSRSLSNQEIGKDRGEFKGDKEELQKLRQRNEFLEDLVKKLRQEISGLKRKSDHSPSQRAEAKWHKTGPKTGLEVPSGQASTAASPTQQSPTARTQPFADLVYQWNVVRGQIDTGMRMTRRAFRFMERLSNLHKKFAGDLEKAAREEKHKASAIKPGDRMMSCRGAFYMVLNQCSQMATVHLQFADNINNTVIMPWTKFYEIGSSISESTSVAEKTHSKSLSTMFQNLRRSEKETQHLIDDLLKQAAKMNRPETLFHKRPKKENIERLQKKTIECMGKHKSVCESVSKQQKAYLETQMPNVLTQMQSIEEMRVTSFRKQILTYGKIIENFSDGYIKAAKDIESLGKVIHKDEDIVNFVSNCARNKELQLPDVQNKLTKTPEELAGDVATLSGKDVFNSSLNEIMESQKKMHPELKVPRIIIALTDAVERLGGYKVEGIFRVPASVKDLEQLKELMRKGDYKVNEGTSPHVPACLLKDFLRKLRDSLIPDAHYEKCVDLSKAGNTIEAKAFEGILSSLPSVNRLATLPLDCVPPSTFLKPSDHA